MTETAIAALDRMWSHFEVLFVIPGSCGQWRQESYRRHFFDAFATVYRSDALSGDAVCEFLTERYLPSSEERRQAKVDVLTEICNAWSEWKYAWDRRSRSPRDDRLDSGR